MDSSEVFLENYVADVGDIEEFEKRRYIAERTLQASVILGAALLVYSYYFDYINNILKVGNAVYYGIGPIAILLFIGGFYSDEINKKHRELSEDRVMYHHLARSIKNFQQGNYDTTIDSLNDFAHFYSSLRRRGQLSKLTPDRKRQLLNYIRYVESLDEPASFIQDEFGEVAEIITEEINAVDHRAITIPEIENNDSPSPTSIFINDVGRIAGRILTGFSGVMIFGGLIGILVYNYVGIQAGLTAIVIVLTAYGLHR